MILVEMQTEEESPFRLAFHPAISIVGTMPAGQRAAVVATMVRLLSGSTDHISATVRLRERFDRLTPELSEELGLGGTEFAGVLGLRDMPGGPPSGPLESPALRAAREQLAEAEAYESSLIGALEEIGTAADFADVAALTRAEEELDLWTKRVEQLREAFGAVPAPEEKQTVGSRLEKLQEAHDAIERRILELKAAVDEERPDTSKIERLLALIRASPGEAGPVESQALLKPLPNPLPTPTQLVGLWAELAADKRAVESEPEPPSWLVEATKRALDNAGTKVQETRARRDAGEATEAELERAELEFHDARAAWAEVEHGKPGAARAFADREKELWRIAAAVFEVGWEDPDWTPRERLVHALEALGEPSGLSTVEEDAERWLAEQAGRDAEIEQLRGALAAAVLDLEEVDAEIESRSGMNEDEPEPIASSPLGEDLAKAQEQYRMARERLDAMQLAGADRVTSSALYRPLQDKRAKARDAVVAARRNVEEMRRTEMAAVPPRSRPRPPFGPSRIGIDPREVEAYLFSRVGRLQAAAGKEPLPIIFDAAFDHFEAPVIRYLLDSLIGLSQSVQIVYFTSTAVAEDWAFRQPPMVAGVSRLSKA